MELYPISAAAAHGGNFLTTFYHITFFNVNPIGVRVGTEKIAIVFDDNKLTITAKSTTLIHDLARCRSAYCLSASTANV